MKAARLSEVADEFKPTEEDDHSVVVVRYDLMKAPSDDDYITTPYEYDELQDIPDPPDKPDTEYIILTQDNGMFDVADLRENPPEWFNKFEKE